MQTLCNLRISPSDPHLSYMGRIDFSLPEEPLFVYPCSWVSVRFCGKSIQADITNLHSYYENSLGVVLDGTIRKVILPESGRAVLTLGEDLPEGEHELMLYKRMDACHYYKFHGFLLPEHAKLLPPPEKQKRRMEFYGDSVTAGEVSELVDYCGQPDPSHNGEFSNSYYSYAWYTARMLDAQIHDVAQGGIALLTGTGYYCAPHLIGMDQLYDKIQCNPGICPPVDWDFSRYTPHVVVVAIGQNDNHPVDIMEQGMESEAAKNWRTRYRAFICTLRSRYPWATILLTTTILNHNAAWDDAIDAVCRELGDEKIHHFLYSDNGRGTPGHIRQPEAEKMAQELSSFIRSLGEEIWEDAI